MYQLIVIMLTALLRQLLFVAFGALIERGIWTQDQLGQIAIGMAGVLVVGAWSLWKNGRVIGRYHTRAEALAAAFSK